MKFYGTALFVFILSCCLLSSSVLTSGCNSKFVSADSLLKGKLVIKELCGHYVVQVISGRLDTAYVTNGWNDEKRNKTYDNVFSVSNRCSFPAADMKEGDEFEFRIDRNPVQEDCAVCMAYYPTPPKRNAVRVAP